MNTQESIKILDQLMRSEELHYDTEATDALHHAIEHMKRGQWRPIETAPKDGPRFLAKGEHPRSIAVAYYGHLGDLFINGTLKKWNEPSMQPTHWMPLPEQPQEIRDQWQPIETAPKDGTGVLLCISIGDGHHVQYTGSYHDGHWWVTNFSGEDEYWYTPTDWRPLDEPPQERKN